MIRQRTCPICHQELPVTITGDDPVFPFCSKRCKLADLYRWMNGQYSIEELLTPEKLADLAIEDSERESP